jgi:hypothetical protein
MKYECSDFGGMILTRQNISTRKNTRPSATSSATNPARTALVKKHYLQRVN